MLPLYNCARGQCLARITQKPYTRRNHTGVSLLPSWHNKAYTCYARCAAASAHTTELERLNSCTCSAPVKNIHSVYVCHQWFIWHSYMKCSTKHVQDSARPGLRQLASSEPLVSQCLPCSTQRVDQHPMHYSLAYICNYLLRKWPALGSPKQDKICA